MSKIKRINYDPHYRRPYGNGGFLEVGGGALSGAASGAAIGSAIPIPGIGTLVGAGVGAIAGGIGSVLKRNERRKQENQLILEQNRHRQRESLFESNSQAVLGTYNTRGINTDTFAMGGAVGSSINTNSGQSVQLADGMELFKGPKHEGGGIPIDIDSDMIQDAEVEGDEVFQEEGRRIYSDRLKPSKEVLDQLYTETGYRFNGTYANVAESIGRKKGKIDNTETVQSQNKEDITNERLDKGLDIIFNDQETNKSIKTKDYRYGGTLKYPHGGPLPHPDILDKVSEKDTQKYINQTGFSYRKKLNDGSYMIVSNNPLPGYSGEFEPELSFELPEEKIENAPKEMYNKPSMKKVKEAPKYDSNKRKMTDRKWFGMFNQGGTLGSVPQDVYPEPVNPNLDIGGATGGNFGDWFSSNSSTISNVGGQVGNFLSYLGNKKDINRMKTLQTPVLAPQPRFNYNSIVGQQKAEAAELEREAAGGIRNSSIQNKGANLAMLRGKRIGENNRISSENILRRDQAQNSYDFMTSRNNIYNAGQINQTGRLNLENYNDQIALGVGNRNALVQGITGNEAVRRQRESDEIQALLASVIQGDTEALTRFLKEYPEVAKRLNISKLINK